MAKVYLVTAGEYSDYHIEGVFSTPEKAQEYLNIVSGDEIEEFEIDSLDNVINLKKQGYHSYNVFMEHNGNTRNIFPQSSNPSVETNYNLLTYGGFQNKESLLKVSCWAKNEAHAVKIANEIRAQLIANNEWQTQ